MLKQIPAGVLKVGYDDHGPSAGPAVILLHGFPYDVHAYDDVSPILSSNGCRVIVPYLRGYGPTRFLYPETPRSGQQAVLAHDLIALMDALDIPKAVLAGYDWGGRAACITAALWPDRTKGLLSVGGYNIQDISRSVKPQLPENEYRYWYQYYFHSDRGKAGLTEHRRRFCKQLWKLWSPTWKFTDADFEKTAPSFDNPDFVEVVIHSYRHRYGLVAGDPSAEETEERLKEKPRITVPTISMEGQDDGLTFIGEHPDERPLFTGAYEHRKIAGAGHNLPQETPQAFADALLSLL